MKVYVSHISALHFWRLWEAEAFLGEGRTRKHALTGCCTSMADDTGSVPSPLHFGPGKVHVIVPDAKLRVNPREYAYHVWSQKVPERSLMRYSESIYLPSPEFCFMQMAQVLSVPGLIALGMELCGSYRLQQHEPAENEHDALTTPGKLARFVENCHGIKGYKRAKRACAWILAGSASPMETWSYERLCLPARMSGYALPKPCPNGEMQLNKRQQALADRTTSFGDLYWSEQHVVVEYFGKKDHTGAERMRSDAKRGNALESRATKLYTLTDEIYFDLVKFDAFAREIARALGVRIRSRNDDLGFRSWELMEELQEQERLTFPEEEDPEGRGDGLWPWNC